MIWRVIKKSATDFWDEMLYLILFNIIWLIGTALILPWPFVTFGLFGLVYDVGEGKGIKFSTFFTHAAGMWRQAYVWGGINLAILLVIWINFNFYATIAAQWAAIVQLSLLSLLIFWAILQLFALAFYPRLEQPAFKLALRNAAIAIGQNPLVVLTLVIIIALVILLALFVQAILFLGAFALIALVANNLVGAIIAQKLARQVEG